jgi:hypothetical protein
MAMETHSTRAAAACPPAATSNRSQSSASGDGLPADDQKSPFGSTVFAARVRGCGRGAEVGWEMGARQERQGS